MSQITTKFAQSLAYVTYHIYFNRKAKKENVVFDEKDEQAYEILKKADLNELGKIWSKQIPLSLRHQNEPFLGERIHPDDHPIQGGLYLEQLFSNDRKADPDADLVCVGCGQDVRPCDPYQCDQPKNEDY